MKISRLSDKQKNYAFIALAVTAVVGVFLGMNVTPQQSAVIQSEITATPTSSKPVVSTSNGISMSNVSATHNDVAPVKSAMKAATISADATPKAGWVVGDVKASVPTIPLNERISQYQIVNVEHPETYPEAGQQMSLPMLNGKEVVVNIESTSVLQNGDHSWSGHLEGSGTDYPVVMTYGENSIFATITTPEGSYTMESVNGSGWLYKNPSEFELSNPGFKDFLEVDSQ